MPNERLRDAILKQGLTPAALAEKLGVDAKTAERWLTQDRVPYPRHRSAISALLREREAYLWPNALPPDRATRVGQSELVELFPRRSAVPDALWRRFIGDAQEQIGILVYAGLFLPEQYPRLVQTLRAKASKGVRVRILLGDPESEEVAQRGTDEGIGDAMAGKVRNVMAFYGKLKGIDGVSVHYHRTILYNSIYRFDDEMLVNTHIYGVPAAHAPVMHLRQLSSGDFFDTYAESFERVWEGSKSAWPASVQG
jgi:transcriptional regulator with XRE-family HTH domain